jgi:hypothetical protein
MTGAYLRCPVCSVMVKLPATECYSCHANLRTGEKPEEKLPFWHRKKLRALILLSVFLMPALIYAVYNGIIGQNVLEYGKSRLGLSHCADPPLIWDRFSQSNFESFVKSGYGSWKNSRQSRRLGQSATGPETPEEAIMTAQERLARDDARRYFASFLMSDSRSKAIMPKNDWYGPLKGEWDVVWMQSMGEREEKLLAGEWIFSWINGGDSLLDVLAVPYLWQYQKAGPDSVRITTLRTFNHATQLWEGAHSQNGKLLPFNSSMNGEGLIMETYMTDEITTEVWVIGDITPDSFRVTISQTKDNGQTWKQVSEVWAKRRGIEMVE